MGNVGGLVVAAIIDWLHLIAMVAWIGGVFINNLALSPSARESLEPPVMGRFMGSYMKRFRVLAYVCMGILVVTGVIMTFFSPQYAGGFDLSGPWALFLLLKHILVVVLIIIGVYILEVLNPKMGRAGAKGPSPEIAKLQALLLKLGMTSFGIGLLVLLFTAVTSVV